MTVDLGVPKAISKVYKGDKQRDQLLLVSFVLC